MAKTIFLFSGMNNVLDAAEIPKDDTREAAYSTAADLLNVDPGDAGKARRRTGFSKVSTDPYHTLFSVDGTCYGVSGRSLRQITPDFQTTELALLTSTARGRFVWSPVGVFYTNADDIGLISGGAYAPLESPSPTVDVEGVSVPSYKVALPAGKFICWYNGRLYSLRQEGGESWLYCTDGYALHMDIRDGYFRFDGEPTALVAVDDGLYVGAGNRLYFIPGAGPDDFEERRALDFAIVPGAFTADRSEDLSLNDSTGRVAIFLARSGCVLGHNGGRITQHREVAPETSLNMAGVTYIRKARGEIHCVSVLQGDGDPGNRYT